MLFIVGDADAIVPPGEVITLARRYRRAQALVVPGAGHLRALWTDKEGYMSAVLGFLDRSLATPAASRPAHVQATTSEAALSCDWA
jgi:pimeloyl-ACP methyl ester carboxylesterase